MKNIFTNEKLIIVILLILLGLGISYHFNNNSKQEKKYEAEVKLREALQDTVRTYQTKEGDWVSEKRTLQGDVDDLLSDNIKLNNDQRALLKTISDINSDRNSDKEVWAAASIRYKKLIDSLSVYVAGASDIDTINSVVSFKQNDSTSNFIYDFNVLNVRPYPLNRIPELKINTLDFPNKQTITFNFDENERKDYPLSFSVINTNPYYKVSNIESYAIPTIDKDIVNPTGWQKFSGWMKQNGKYFLVGLGGFGLGSVLN